MRRHATYGARLGAIMALTTFLPALLAANAAATTIAQNSSWTVSRPGATQTLRIVAYGDSIFAGYTGATTAARRAAPYVAGEYCAALSGQNYQVHRRCQSGGVASDIYNRIHSTTDRAFMQDAATRIVTFEMCGNDYLQARSSFKSAAGTCNYTGLNNAFNNCKNFTQLAMNDINQFANANTRLKIVSNLYYPGFNADNSFSTCTDPVNGDPANGNRVNMQTLFIPRLAESNWWVCKLAADNGFQCADSFATYMARDYDSNGDGLKDSDAIRYQPGETMENYRARIVSLRSTLRDANLKMVNTTTSFDYIQSDDTHPTFEGATASTFLTTPGGSNPVFFATAGPYPDGMNPHWNQNGHDRMGWMLDPTCTFTPPRCGNGAIDTTWLPSGTASVEACDDANIVAGDGCSSTCGVEPGYFCSGAPSMCAPICGDGLVTGPEQCDDGNTNIHDGCSATCTVEPGFSCMGHPSSCQYICGDGLIVTGEGCDDGNLGPDDGCSASCTVEDGWSCAGEPSMCAPICGDSLILGTETCDEGDDNGTFPSCCSTNCNPEPDGTSCDDGNACTVDDICDGANTCGGSPKNCDDGNPCTDDSCDPSSGCIHTNNTASCTDGNACTTNDTCASGTCVGGAALECNDGNGCTDDSCNPESGCVNTNNTAPCNDGNACTTSDTCAEGTCVGGAPPNCDDSNGCTDDSCNPASGCVNANNTDPCNDGSACTTADTCAGGTCVGGAPPNCNDGNGCTDDSCNPASGCVNTNNTAPCSDGNACTTADTCAGGTCVGGAPPNCNDGNGCTDDSCNPASGCVNANNANPCNDGNACTTADTCSGGACVGGAPPNCNDGNVCTTDTCNPASGCLNANNTAPCSDGNSCTAPDVCGGGTCNSGPPVYGFGGFLAPVDNLPTVNVGNSGRTYPIKWQLPLCSGGYVNRLSAVVYNPLRIREVNCTSNAPLDTLETDTPGSSGLTYDTGSNEYHYNWKTSTTFANKCYELLLELDNGTTQIARFKFNK